jgi:dihydrofolate reductase
MRKVIYGMNVSLDGFIAGPGDDINWSVPDEELHRFHGEQVRATGVSLYGRKLYEVMRYWETAEEQNPSAPEYEHEFARVWNDTPRIVFSRTLERAEGGAELATDGIGETIERLREQPGGHISIGGAGLAAEAIRLGLVDEYHLWVAPIVLGAGTPFFPSLEQPIPLRLIETRTFGMGVVYVRYERR